jgi:hypothetical protein
MVQKATEDTCMKMLRCDSIRSSHVPLDRSLEFKVVVHDSQLSEILEFMGA